MPVTIRTDGVLYNDGTFQNTAFFGINRATETAAGLVAPALTLHTRPNQGDYIVDLQAISDTPLFGPGRGQRWYDMRSSRSLNVNYVNSTRRGITVSVSSNNVWRQGARVILRMYVAGRLVIVNGGQVSQRSGGTSSSYDNMGNAAGTVIVPPGQTYRVEVESKQQLEAAPPGFTTWAELR